MQHDNRLILAVFTQVIYLKVKYKVSNNSNSVTAMRFFRKIDIIHHDVRRNTYANKLCFVRMFLRMYCSTNDVSHCYLLFYVPLKCIDNIKLRNSYVLLNLKKT